jgi:hypothetical protein
MMTRREVIMVQASSIKPAGKPRSDDGGCEDLAREVTQLSARNTATLRAKWAALFGAAPSHRLGRRFMRRAIAYRLQESMFGGLKPSTERLLDRVCDTEGKTTLEHIAKPRAGAGTVLIREWHGVSHRVTMLDEEVMYQGRRYKSLSEVARLITGTRWSGPLFFRLKRRIEELANG